jgi:hypothetical protein
VTIPYLTIEMHLRDVEAADIERLLRMLKEMGGTYTVIERAAAPVAIPMPPDIPGPEPQPPSPPPVPEAKWWESLKVTDPKTKIYGARAGTGAQVYYSDGPDRLPSFDQRSLTPGGQLWTLPFGTDVEVWRVPLPISGWICVHIKPERALWVRGEDMRATP